MRLIDADEIISILEQAKFFNANDTSSEMFNLGIYKAIDLINSSPTIDAKLKVDKREYQRLYYQKVTKQKRQEKKANNRKEKTL